MPVNASTDARGYGWQHQRLRAQWRPVVEEGGVGCARCGQLIVPGSPWHLGHTEDRTGYVGPEHQRCNTQAGGRRGNRVRWRRVTSLEW